MTSRDRLRLAVLLVLPLWYPGLLGLGHCLQDASGAAPALDRLLPARAEIVYQALDRRFDAARAMETVTFMDRFWRLPGNPGYLASLDRLRAGLEEAGFVARATSPAAAQPAPGAAPPNSRPGLFWFEQYPNGGNGWELVRAEVTMPGALPADPPVPVFDPERDRVALAINSFSTAAGGLSAPLVDVGSGLSPTDYEGKAVRGAVVLGDAALRGLFEQAVRLRGAAGVISAAPPPAYTKPDETPEIFQWGAVPYDETLKAFGFKASRAVASRLRARLARGPVQLNVAIETRFHPSLGRTLVAEIPGTVRPDERVVMVAHVQEPGANDNASGCATLLETARALARAIAAQAVPPPGRTLTFIWGDEIRASREWLRADAARPAQARYMISLDMTGEDTAKTGGSFLIEKEPDPSAVWSRPSDPHTEWGGGSYPAGALRGSLLNDLHLAVCLRRARNTGWMVRTNPYEGGSDHSVFLAAGVLSLLVWHFPDRYYHTNLDRADKTSAREMAHVGITVGTTAMLLASAGETEAMAIVDLLAAAAGQRLALEARQGAIMIKNAQDRAAAEATEREVAEAWTRWYEQALTSALSLPVTPASDRLQARVAKARAGLRR